METASRRRRISFVVIGLNEAESLASSIGSLSDQGLERDEFEVIYVDSGSDDESVAIALRENVDALVEIPRASASAARARNAGLERATAPLVHFVDGDTRLEPGWARLAADAIEAEPKLVGVEGHLRELHPGASLYDAVCELDWFVPVGPADYVGGNALYRAQPLREVGGFDPAMCVGEEPELGARLLDRSWELRHLDAPMACHHLDIGSLRAYLRRNYTSGVACALVAAKSRGLRTGFGRARLRRTLVFAALLSAPFLLALPMLALAPRAAAVLFGVGLVALLGLAARKAAERRRRGSNIRVAAAFGLHTYLSKIPVAVGILSVIARPAAATARSRRHDADEPM